MFDRLSLSLWIGLQAFSQFARKVGELHNVAPADGTVHRTAKALDS
jgi:hypothetical protein